MKKFWMVLGKGVPRVEHLTEGTARSEALRLAQINPGESFTVLESLATVKICNISWEEHDMEIPF